MCMILRKQRDLHSDTTCGNASRLCNFRYFSFEYVYDFTKAAGIWVVLPPAETRAKFKSNKCKDSDCMILQKSRTVKPERPQDYSTSTLLLSERVADCWGVLRNGALWTKRYFKRNKRCKRSVAPHQIESELSEWPADVNQQELWVAKTYHLKIIIIK